MLICTGEKKKDSLINFRPASEELPAAAADRNVSSVRAGRRNSAAGCGPISRKSRPGQELEI